MTATTYLALAALAAAFLAGIVLAPAMTFFAALAAVVLIGLDRAARAADDVFTSLAAR